MTRWIMGCCVAALCALAAATPDASAGSAGRCLIEPGAERLVLLPSAALVRPPEELAMPSHVLSVVARNIGHFDVELVFDGPFLGATREDQANLMRVVAIEFGLPAEPAADDPETGGR